VSFTIYKKVGEGRGGGFKVIRSMCHPEGGETSHPSLASCQMKKGRVQRLVFFKGGGKKGGKEAWLIHSALRPREEGGRSVLEQGRKSLGDKNTK